MMRKAFYNQDFQISLDFRGKGQLSGILKNLRPLKTISYEINGFYFTKPLETRFAFIIDWHFPILKPKMTSAFHGTIYTTRNGSVLILDWLSFTESQKGIVEDSIVNHSRILIDDLASSQKQGHRIDLPNPVPKLREAITTLVN